VPGTVRSKNSATIIATNFAPADIMQKYDQRIASRILSPKTSVLVQFTGKDLRLS
jgi:hypothetical protein